MALTEEQKRFLDENQPEIESQRLRKLAAGLTFNFADEAEAYLRSTLGGEDYEAALVDVRSKVQAYEQANPGEAFSYELGGAALPAVASMIFSGGATAPAAGAKLFPTLAKIYGTRAPTTTLGTAGTVTTQGALSGMGAAEEGERFEGAAKGSLYGLGGGMAVHGGMKLGGKLVDSVVDSVRQKFGDRVGTQVSNQLKALMEEHNLSADEVVEGIRNGSIIAENETLANAIRGIYAKGGPGAVKLEETFGTRTSTQGSRTEELTGAAEESIAKTLGSGADENLYRTMRLGEEEAQAEARAAYKPLEGVPISQQLVDELKTVLSRNPSAGAELNKAYIRRTGRPLFERKKDPESGEVIVRFLQEPSAFDAERVRRALGGAAQREYKACYGTSAEAAAEAQTGLRGRLDTEVPAVGEARAGVAASKLSQESFKQGLASLTKPFQLIANEFEIVASKGPDAITAYRQGVAQAIANQMGGQRRASIMTNLANPEHHMNKILDLVAPDDLRGMMMADINAAVKSQAARKNIIQGSQTGFTNQQAQRQSRPAVGVTDVADVAGGGVQSITGLSRIIGNFVNRAAPELNDAQRAQLVDLLVTEDADLVARALQSTEGQKKLAEVIARLANTVKAGGLRAGTEGAPEASNSLMDMIAP